MLFYISDPLVSWLVCCLQYKTKSAVHALVAPIEWHFSFPLMNSFNKTKAAISPFKLCCHRTFPFHRLICLRREVNSIQKCTCLFGGGGTYNKTLFNTCNTISFTHVYPTNHTLTNTCTRILYVKYCFRLYDTTRKVDRHFTFK